VRFLLSKNVPIYIEDIGKRDNSAIFYAITENNQISLEMFVDLNTEALNHFVDSQGNNVIMHAAFIGNWDAVNYLSIRGLYLNCEDEKGQTLLARVLAGDKYELAGRLIRRGLDINHLNKNGRTTLSLLC
jgi:ankyrin repeat protein